MHFVTTGKNRREGIKVESKEEGREEGRKRL
jgi:hypothetical protein